MGAGLKGGGMRAEGLCFGLRLESRWEGTTRGGERKGRAKMGGADEGVCGSLLPGPVRYIHLVRC